MKQQYLHTSYIDCQVPKAQKFTTFMHIADIVGDNAGRTNDQTGMKRKIQRLTYNQNYDY